MKLEEKAMPEQGKQKRRMSYAMRDSLTLTAQTTGAVQTFTPATADIDASGTKDSTAGIQAALNSAGTAGGGIVTVPRGRYKLSSELTIPAGVTLSGAAREHTSLYWVTQATGNPSMIAAAENAALRDVSISVSGSYGDVISAVSGFSMTNVTLRANAYFHHATQGKIGGTYSGPAVSEKPYQLGSVLAAEGRLLWTGRAQNTLAADVQDTLTVTANALPTGAATARLFTWSDSRPMQLVREMTMK